MGNMAAQYWTVVFSNLPLGISAEGNKSKPLWFVFD